MNITVSNITDWLRRNRKAVRQALRVYSQGVVDQKIEEGIQSVISGQNPAIQHPVLAINPVTITVGSSGEYDTLTGALFAASEIRPAFQTATGFVTINQLTGFALNESIEFVDIDLSYVRITSDDATVSANPGAGNDLFSGENAKLPTIECLYNMGGNGDDGIYLLNSTARIIAAAGVTNAGGDGVQADRSSVADATAANFGGAGGFGFRVLHGSIINKGSATGTSSQTENIWTTSGFIGDVGGIESNIIRNAAGGLNVGDAAVYPLMVLAEGTGDEQQVSNLAILAGVNTFTGAQIFLDDIQVGDDIGTRTENTHFEGDGFDPALFGNEAVYVVCKPQSSGVGVLGAGVAFNRVDGTARRRAAIVAKQTGSNTNQTGLAFFVNQNTSTAHDFVSERVVINHDGSMDIDGDLDVVGALTKGSGSFLIDHPLDKENKNLIYSFIEGPRRDLLYRGVVTLKNGKATVDIDQASSQMKGTFEALTKNTVVAGLQNMDSFNRLKASEITEGSFTIECEDASSTDQVVWVVLAERDDDFVRNRDPHTGEDGSLIPEWEKEEPAEVNIDGRKTTAIRENKGRKGYPRHAKACGYDEDDLYCDEKAYREFQQTEDKKPTTPITIHKVIAEDGKLVSITCTITESGKSVRRRLPIAKEVEIDQCSVDDLIKLVDSNQQVKEMRKKLAAQAEKEKSRDVYIITEGQLTRKQ